MADMGSLPEWQEFFRSEAKRPYRFQDRDATSVLTDCGWFAEGLLFADDSYRFHLRRLADMFQIWSVAVLGKGVFLWRSR